jgi:hypothetical protein
MKFFDSQVLNVHHLHHKLACYTCLETLHVSDNIHTVMTVKYLSNTTNTFLFNDKNRLHVSAYHKPSSGQLFTHSTNCILRCVRVMGSHMT